MIIGFDSFRCAEKPQLVLCNPGCYLKSDGTLSSPVGIIFGTEAEENVCNFNTPSELNFRLNIVDAEADSGYVESIKSIFNAVKARRLIFQEGIGFFEIISVSDGTDGIRRYKDVSAKSIETELEHWKVPWIDGTIQLKSLLDGIISTAPGWAVYDSIDQDLLNKYRTFEDVDVNKSCFSFLMEDMQKAYECIFIFDIIHRVIYAYDQNTYNKKTSIFLSREDLIKSSTVDENADELYTVMTGIGENNITFHPVNPLGNGVIYNFGYYKGWMSNGLREKVSQWEVDVEEEESEYIRLSERYFELLDKRNDLELEKSRFVTQKEMYEKCLDNVKNSVNGTNIDVKELQEMIKTAEEAWVI